MHLDDLPRRDPVRRDEGSLIQRQQGFGHTHEEHRLLLAPMAIDGKEALGSMGTDTPPAVLSDRNRPIYDFFKQLFAQVTNPPLDAIREELVTSLYARVGPEGNLFDPQPSSCRTVHLDSPVITDEDLARLVGIDGPGGLGDFRTEVLGALYVVADGGEGLRRALNGLREAASAAIDAGANILVVSDRGSDERLAPVPSLLAVSAVHQHLVAERTRTRVGLVSESGDAREVHHLCLHLGYGANAVQPLPGLRDRLQHGVGGAVRARAVAGGRGRSPQLREGRVRGHPQGDVQDGHLHDGLLHRAPRSSRPSDWGQSWLTSTSPAPPAASAASVWRRSRPPVAVRHRRAFPANPTGRAHRTIKAGGEYQWRREGEYHLFNPETVFKLQHATRDRRFDIFREYTRRVDDQSSRLGTVRGLFRLRAGVRPPVPIEDVESVSEVVKRFATGAMSYGSISKEAHETLAIAMNRIGGKSNTGEGGEDARPLRRRPQRRPEAQRGEAGRVGALRGDQRVPGQRGRHPDQDGPGGQAGRGRPAAGPQGVPVDRQDPPLHAGRGTHLTAAATTTIYSIEDLAQLIHDLKNANPSARVHVKLVAEVGVGTVAAGVSKAHADVVLISGNDGGTGASPLTSIKHAGAPWELGLAETQQTLLLNNLRDHIVVQVDGQLKTGRDRGDRRAAGCRGVWFRHRAAGGDGLRDDEGVPPRHLPGGGGHPESRAAQEVLGTARVRGQLLRVHR